MEQLIWTAYQPADKPFYSCIKQHLDAQLIKCCSAKTVFKGEHPVHPPVIIYPLSTALNPLYAIHTTQPGRHGSCHASRVQLHGKSAENRNGDQPNSEPDSTFIINCNTRPATLSYWERQSALSPDCGAPSSSTRSVRRALGAINTPGRCRRRIILQ